MNKVFEIGYLANDPQHQYTKSNKPVCTFRLAVARKFTNQHGVREADFFNVVAWGKLADLAAQWLRKGSRAAVIGSLQTRSYDDKEGVKRYVTEIVADEIEFLSAAKADGAQGEDPTGFVQVDDDELPF